MDPVNGKKNVRFQGLKVMALYILSEAVCLRFVIFLPPKRRKSSFKYTSHEDERARHDKCNAQIVKKKLKVCFT